MLRRLFTVCLVMVAPILGTAQEAVGVVPSRQTVAQELEEVITEAKRLNNKNAFVNLSARAAALISLSDPTRGEAMFLELWKMSQVQGEKDFDSNKARIQILKYLYSRNSKLARRLLAERQAQSKSTEAARSVGFDEESQLPGNVAAALLDLDPGAAAAVLENNLTTAVTMEGLGALSQLRERNFLLADYIAGKTLDSMITRSTLASLPGLNLLGAYVFAGAEAPLPSIEADYSRSSLQQRYFVTGVEVLRASLNESRESLVNDQHLTPSLLQFRAAYQAELAAILAALATRIQPSLAPELAGIATQLAPQVPARMPRLQPTTLARLSGNFNSEDPEQRFLFALSSGDFGSARRELERLKDADKRKSYEQLVIKSEARAFLARSELMEAVTAIRKLEDPTMRLVMYLDALKAAKSKRDGDVARIVINEARLMIPQTNRNGLHLRAQLAFSSQLARLGAPEEAFEFLRGAVSSINALSHPAENVSKGEADSPMAELNDPNSLFDEPEFEKAFSTVGSLDMDMGLTQARTIQPKPIQLLARLLTIQGVIKQEAAKPKPKPAPQASPSVKTPKP